MFLLFWGIGAYWTHMGQSLYKNEQRFFMSELVSAQASAIERRLSRALSSTRILAQVVRLNHGLFEGFESYAAEILRSIEGVSNLQLAPHGVISHIYPLSGNEKALGHDLLNDAQRRKEAMQAIKERRLTLAGPFELIQGGVAVIGRAPIYLPGEKEEQFWGFASAVIYLEDLLKVTELDPSGAKGYSFQLSRQHPDTGEEEVFARSSTPLMTDHYTIDVNVPGGTWKLVMSRATPTPKWRSKTGYTASILAGLLMAWVAYFVLAQPEKLQRIVNEKTQALERLAYNDHLTGLSNRRYLSEQLLRVVQNYQRHGKPAVLMYLDLDDFKRVNDTMGHDAGDSLLCEIATRLVACIRANDLVARLGGDEFGILLRDSESVRDVSRIAEKLIHTIEQPVILSNKSFVVSTSVGITMIPGDGQDATALLRNADLAMYAAKKAGKRNFSFYDQSLQAQAMAKLQMEDDLAEALAQQQFLLHYQPINDIYSGSPVGYEALIRWQHPAKGLLFPEGFICVAEETGKIVEIGYWAIAEVCRRIADDEQHARPMRRYSINLSPKQFMDPALLENIGQIVLETKISAELLEFEVTESGLMEDIDDAANTLAGLKKLGVSVAIDDFGTGYSSLALLKYLPVDRLKIDRSFIHDLDTDISDKQIVQGVISMAHKLQLDVVAEGIENDAQLALLKRYRCDLGQGNYYSEPLPVEALKALESGINPSTVHRPERIAD